jgi:polysaccharide export outer membrane protein
MAITKRWWSVFTRKRRGFYKVKHLNLFLMIIGLTLALMTSIGIHAIEAAEESRIEAYKVGVNDVISIRVIDHAEMSTLATVSADGSIILPYIGSIYVKDQKLSEIEEEITNRLSEGYIKYPVVTVSLMKSMSRKLYVYGEVARPGMYPLEEETTTILRMLSVAGGIRTDGLYGNIKLRRKQKDGVNYKEISLGTKDTVENSEAGNTAMQPDDVLIVERNKTFLIQGEVTRRGRYALEKDMTALRALVEAGGVTPEGLYGNLMVRRKQKAISGGYKIIAESKINNGIVVDGKVENTLLQPDDILVVKRNQTFLIRGEVGKRGRFTLEKDMTVLRALLEAGGVTADGRYGRIKVRRKKEDNPGEYKDLVESQLNNGVIESSKVEDIVLQPDDILIVERNATIFIHGEVGRTGEFVLEEGMTVTKAISLAGGIRSDGLYGKVKIRRKQEIAPGYFDVEIDLKGTRKDTASGNMLLKPDDVLIVERNDTFFIYGEVNKTGEYVYKDGITVFQAITVAGGLTKWGSESRVKILRRQKDNSGFEIIEVNVGDVIDGDANADIKLEPDDTIVMSSSIF